MDHRSRAGRYGEIASAKVRAPIAGWEINGRGDGFRTGPSASVRTARTTRTLLWRFAPDVAVTATVFSSQIGGVGQVPRELRVPQDADRCYADSCES